MPLARGKSPRPTPTARCSSPPMPAPARPTCWRSASSTCCCAATTRRKSSASPSPRPPPPTWRTRVFETLARMDRARRRRARRQDPREHRASRRCRRSARARGGCLPARWRRRAGSRCRPSTPSARGCCISFRSRPTSPHASRCSTTPRRRSCSNELTLDVMLEARGRSRRRARPGAGERHHRGGRHHLQGGDRRNHPQARRWSPPGSTRAGGVPQAIAELYPRARRSTPDDTMQQVEAEYFAGSLIPQAEWPALIAASLAQRQRRPTREQRRRARRLRATPPAATRIDAYLRCLLHRQARRPRNSVITKTLATKHPRWAERLHAEQDRVCALVAREFALRARDRSAALLTIAFAVIERYRARKGAPRPARLRRPDRQDAGAVRADLGRLGALQARSRHRPRAGRRGAGHQPRAMGRSSRRWCPNSCRPAPGARRSKRTDLRRRRREAVDLLVSGRGAASTSRRCATISDALYETSDIPFATKNCDYSFRSAAEVLDAVDMVFRAAAGVPRADLRRRRGRCIRRCPTPRPGEVEIWELIAPDEKDEGKEGWDAPFDTTTRDQPARSSWRRAIAAHGQDRWVAARHAAARRAHSGAPARPVLRGGDPRAQDARPSMSPAPTGWC